MSWYAEACHHQRVKRGMRSSHSVAISQAISRSVNSITGNSRRSTTWRLPYCVGHYDIISALHKSLRGSDPDAALYWLARMLEAGEDPLYVVRRLIRFASEDVGMADPQALLVCVAAQQAVHFIGMPEGALALAQAVIHLATAPQSNAVYTAYGAAVEDVRTTRNDPVPLHLRNAPTRLMKALDYGKGYAYAHDVYAGQPDPADPLRPPPERPQDYLPENLRERAYYQPGTQGNEASIAAWLERRRT